MTKSINRKIKEVPLKPHWWHPPKVKARLLQYQEGLDIVRSIKFKSDWENKRQIVRKKDKRTSINVEAILAEVERNVGPPWYQELSPEQMNAADHLICVMRDDWYEDEIYRTMNILTTLGVCPTARRAAVRDAICKSCRRPVDFLLLMFKSFRGRDPLVLQKDYSVNERLMLSAIAHLCLYQTLRELDRRLPAGLQPREQIENTLDCLMQKAHYQSSARVKRPNDDPILQRNPCAKYREYLEVPSWPKYPKSVFYKPFNVKQPSLAPYDRPRCPGLKDHRPDLMGQKKKSRKECFCYDEKYAEGGEEVEKGGKKKKKPPRKGRRDGRGPKGGGHRGRGGGLGIRRGLSKESLGTLRRGSGVTYKYKRDSRMPIPNIAAKDDEGGKDSIGAIRYSRGKGAGKPPAEAKIKGLTKPKGGKGPVSRDETIVNVVKTISGKPVTEADSEILISVADLKSREGKIGAEGDGMGDGMEAAEGEPVLNKEKGGPSNKTSTDRRVEAQPTAAESKAGMSKKSSGSGAQGEGVPQKSSVRGTSEESISKKGSGIDVPGERLSQTSSGKGSSGERISKKSSGEDITGERSPKKSSGRGIPREGKYAKKIGRDITDEEISIESSESGIPGEDIPRKSFGKSIPVEAKTQKKTGRGIVREGVTGKGTGKGIQGKGLSQKGTARGMSGKGTPQKSTRAGIPEERIPQKIGKRGIPGKDISEEEIPQKASMKGALEKEIPQKSIARGVSGERVPQKSIGRGTPENESSGRALPGQRMPKKSSEGSVRVEQIPQKSSGRDISRGRGVPKKEIPQKISGRALPGDGIPQKSSGADIPVKEMPQMSRGRGSTAKETPQKSIERGTPDKGIPQKSHTRGRPDKEIQEKGRGRAISGEETPQKSRGRSTPEEEMPQKSMARAIPGEEIRQKSSGRAITGDEIPQKSRGKGTLDKEIQEKSRGSAISGEETPQKSRRRSTSETEIPQKSRRKIAPEKEIPQKSSGRAIPGEEIPQRRSGRGISGESIPQKSRGKGKPEKQIPQKSSVRGISAEGIPQKSSTRRAPGEFQQKSSAAGIAGKSSRKHGGRAKKEKLDKMSDKSSISKTSSDKKYLPKKTAKTKKPKRPRITGEKEVLSDDSEEDEEEEWGGKGPKRGGGGGPRGPRGPRGPKGGGASGARRPLARRGGRGQRPRKKARDIQSGSYIDYKMNATGSEGPGIALELLTTGLAKNKAGVLAMIKGIEEAYNAQRRKIDEQSGLKTLYNLDTSKNQSIEASSSYDVSHPSLQKYESLQKKLQSCGAFSKGAESRDIYRRLFFGSDDSTPLIKYVQPDLHKVRPGASSIIPPRRSIVKSSGKISKGRLKSRHIRSPLEKLRDDARRMHEDFKKTKMEETLDPTLLAEELAWAREQWRFSDLDAALRDQQVYQVMCRDCGGTGIDGLQLQYRFESVMDLCGGSSWPEEDPAKLKRIRDLRETIKLSRGGKKQEEILKMLFAAMVDDDLALAKLPLAHRIPYIKYFMAMRCGFRMTQKIKDNMLKKDMIGVDTLCMRGIKTYIPDEDEISPGCVNKYTWNSKNILKKMSDKVASQVRHNLRRAIVDRVRLMWPLSQNICVPTSTCHATFFALLGGREYDWLAVRPWNSGEYRDISTRDKLCSCVNQDK